MLPGCRSAKPKDARPNVLLVLLDDMSYRIGLYGYPAETPSLDRLAQRGRRFDRAYCQFPLCNPSRTSLMTGWRPERTGVWGNLRNPAPYVRDAVPLQEHFARNGYFTARVGKVYHTPFEKEFRWDAAFEPSELPHGSDESTELLWGAYAGSEEDLPDVQSVRRAEALLAEKRDRPLFMALGLRLPHSPWWVPQAYLDKYPARLMTVPPKPASPVPLEHTGGTIDVPPEREKEALAALQAASTYADALVGRVLQRLDALSLRENTIVVVLGDNGFHAGQHGLWGKSTLFEESARVPLVIAAPGVRQAGTATAALVELIDVYPTLVDLSGLPPVPGLDGVSLRPLLEDPNAAVKGAAFTIKKVGAARKALLGISARTQRYRYTLWPDGTQELYDHASDPDELTNVAGDPARRAARDELRRRIDALPRPAAGSAAARE